MFDNDNDASLVTIGDITAANFITSGLIDGVDVSTLATNDAADFDEESDLTAVLNDNYQAADADLTTIAGFTHTDGNLIVSDGTNWVLESGATARTSLDLGTLATLSSVGAAQIDTDAVASDEIAAGAIGTSEIDDGTIAEADIANDAVTDAKVVDTITASNYLLLAGGTLTGNLLFEGTTANDNELTLAVTDPGADFTLTLPAITGTLITTGDTGTVTNVMIKTGFMGFIPYVRTNKSSKITKIQSANSKIKTHIFPK